jgi:hypothetical protein
MSAHSASLQAKAEEIKASIKAEEIKASIKAEEVERTPSGARCIDDEIKELRKRQRAELLMLQRQQREHELLLQRQQQEMQLLQLTFGQQFLSLSSNSLGTKVVTVFKDWLLSPEHTGNPYPTDAEKAELIAKTGVNSAQLSTWFVNARRRLVSPRHRSPSHKSGGEEMSTTESSPGEETEEGEEEIEEVAEWKKWVEEEVKEVDEELKVKYAEVRAKGAKKAHSITKKAVAKKATKAANGVGKSCVVISAYSPEEKKLRIQRWLAKRERRVFKKTVQYAVRKDFATSRMRVKGRFVQREEENLLREVLSYI